VLAVLNISLNLILVPELGPKGAAIATATSLVLVNVFKTIYIRKVFGYSPFSKQTLYLVIVGLIVLGIGFFLPKISSPFLDLIVRSTVVSLVYIVTVYKMRISEDLNHLLDKYTKGLLTKVLGGK
jgi:O-antigen/teichoic acid export membrane protein